MDTSVCIARGMMWEREAVALGEWSETRTLGVPWAWSSGRRYPHCNIFHQSTWESRPLAWSLVGNSDDPISAFQQLHHKPTNQDLFRAGCGQRCPWPHHWGCQTSTSRSALQWHPSNNSYCQNKKHPTLAKWNRPHSSLNWCWSWLWILENRTWQAVLDCSGWSSLAVWYQGWRWV